MAQHGRRQAEKIVQHIRIRLSGQLWWYKHNVGRTAQYSGDAFIFENIKRPHRTQRKCSVMCLHARSSFRQFSLNSAMWGCPTGTSEFQRNINMEGHRRKIKSFCMSIFANPFTSQRLIYLTPRLISKTIPHKKAVGVPYESYNLCTCTAAAGLSDRSTQCSLWGTNWPYRGFPFLRWTNIPSNLHSSNPQILDLS